MAAVLPTNPYGNKILVQNIPAKATEDKLWIHFQKKINGGQGDVICVTYPKSQTELNNAIVEFENPETVKNILQHCQKMFDTEMQVTVYNEPAFGHTKAQLSPSAIIALSQGPMTLREKLEAVASQSGVMITFQKPYVIAGQFDQVHKAFNMIEVQLEQYRLKQMKEIQEENVPKERSSSKTSRKSPLVSENAVKNDPAIAIVNKHIFAYWKRVRLGHLENLRKKYQVKMEISETYQGSNMAVQFSSRSSLNIDKSPEIGRAQRKFEESYHNFVANLSQSSVDTSFAIGAQENDIDQALEVFQKRNSSYSYRDGKDVQIYALSENDVQAAAQQFYEILMAIIENEQMLVIKMDKTDLRVVVVNGDICKERVSVLVNESSSTAVNEVTAAGGREMAQEFASKVRMLGHSPHGKLIETGPGRKLQCKSVLHYYCSHGAKLDLCDILVRAFFLIENDLKAQTVTLPMHCIGTNMHNAKEEVMNFILKFNSKMTSSSHKHIKEIRIFHPNKKESRKLSKFFTQLKSEWASNLASSSSGNDTKEETVEDCVICLDELSPSGPKMKKLECNHVFHQSCIDKALNITKKCPTCMRFYGTPEGNQPKDGRMSSRLANFKLSGFSCDTIEISYHFPSGVQGPEHPHPGVQYYGTTRTAYLPNNPEGREILLLLQKAFNSRLVFTVGRSVTTGRDDCVTWNDIHHKTSTHGGASNFGYPDPTYLQRVKSELAEKGITSP